MRPIAPPGSSPKSKSRQLAENVFLVTAYTCATLILWPCLLAHAINDDYQIVPKYHVRQYRRQRNAEMVPPKVVKRARSLTPPPPIEGRRKVLGMKALGKKKESRGAEMKIEGQEESLWFRLPAELRIMVYEEVIGKGKVFVGLTVVQDPEHGDEVKREMAKVRGKTYKEKNRDARILTAWRYGWVKMGVIPLLQSCRRIYLEFVPLIYTTPTFTFLKTSAFLSFTSSLLSHRLALIQRIHFDLVFCFKPPPDSPLDYTAITSQVLTRNYLPKFTWKDDITFWHMCCGMMATMEGLKDVGILVAEKTFVIAREAENGIREAVKVVEERGIRVKIEVEGRL